MPFLILEIFQAIRARLQVYLAEPSAARLTVDSSSGVCGCGQRSDHVRGNVAASPMGFMRQVWNTSWQLAQSQGSKFRWM